MSDFRLPPMDISTTPLFPRSRWSNAIHRGTHCTIGCRPQLKVSRLANALGYFSRALSCVIFSGRDVRADDVLTARFVCACTWSRVHEKPRSARCNTGSLVSNVQPL